MRFGATALLLAVICAVAVASVYIAQPIRGQTGSESGLATNELGWFVSSGQFGYLVALVFLVPLGDLLSREHLIVAHLGLVVLGLAATLMLAPDCRSSSGRYFELIRSIGRLFTLPAFRSRALIAVFVFASFGMLSSGMAVPLSEARGARSRRSGRPRQQPAHTDDQRPRPRCDDHRRVHDLLLPRLRPRCGCDDRNRRCCGIGRSTLLGTPFAGAALLTWALGIHAAHATRTTHHGTDARI